MGDKAARLRWYWRRLRAMSPGEVLRRAARTARGARRLLRGSWTAPPPRIAGGREADAGPGSEAAPDDPWTFPARSAEAGSESEALIREADGCLGGEYRMLGLRFREAEIDWHRDPGSGERGGSLRNVWEKNRHHHLTVLALAHALGDRKEYAAEVEAQLRSWANANPVPRGPNWSSALELAIRLLSWVWIERLLRNSSVHRSLFGREGFLWTPIYWHQRRVAEGYAHGSSANNHLIGEMAGLFVAATVWPHFPESDRWRQLAREKLEAEIVRQTFPEGLNREQAFGYHLFTLEFFLLAGLEGERFGEPFSGRYRERLGRMLEVVPLLRDAGGHLPRYGDGDEGMALQLRPRASSRADWLLRAGRVWPGAEVPRPERGSGVLAAGLVAAGAGGGGADSRAGTGADAEARGEAGGTGAERGAPDDRAAVAEATGADPAGSGEGGSVAFPAAGLFVLASRRGTASEVFCLADAGPLGYLSIAAHGHADALSFVLSAGGWPLLVDPGTFTYRRGGPWRTYFRSTPAHNTVTVDGADQSVSGGPFLWTRKANVRVLGWRPAQDGGGLEAEHDGYARLPGRVIHRRRLRLRGRRLEVRDELRGGGRHELEWRFHFAPECAVELEGGTCRARRAAADSGAAAGRSDRETGSNRGDPAAESAGGDPGAAPGRAAEGSGARAGPVGADLELDARPTWNLVRGGRRAGWYSPGFNRKVPAPTLVGSLRADLPLSLTTRIAARPPASSPTEAWSRS